jgi:hypothetical protein
MENAVISQFSDLPALPIFASPYTQLKRGEISANGMICATPADRYLLLGAAPPGVDNQ